MKHSTLFYILLFGFLIFQTGCSPQVNVFPDPRAPLQEAILSGSGPDKVLVIPIIGVINDSPRFGFFADRPSVVEETVIALDMARKDPLVKAVLLKIDSPGGSVTGSDILHREILRFKQDTGKTVTTLMMGMAASGGYYTAVASDYIIAHPTTITGSIGVIFYTVNMEGLLTRFGVQMDPIKSGPHKDMGSPFRSVSEKEREIFYSMIDELNDGFIKAIQNGRPNLTETQVRKLADGRIYTAKQALKHQMIDYIGYAKDAIRITKEKANLPDHARVVIYRRRIPTNDTVYNNSVTKYRLSPGLEQIPFVPRTGFYFIWEPGMSRDLR